MFRPMIITRSPLRISIAGGGTDLPSFYRSHGSLVLAAAIDKYVYLTLNETFVEDLIVKYSRLERVASAAELEHPIVREALRQAGLSGSGLEITSMADIPAGTGLGSSGSFTTALIQVLSVHRREPIDAAILARRACHLEIEVLQEPVGKQDQYIAAYGGVTAFEFRQDDTVGVTPLRMTDDVLYGLEDNLLLFFTGYCRRSSDFLRMQDHATATAQSEMIESLLLVRDLATRSQDALTAGDLDTFAELMNAHWQLKRRRALSNADIDHWYELARNNGAVGGKLVGAGGGGFLLFYAADKARLRRAMAEAGLKEVRFRFDFEGTSVLVQ